MRRSTGTEAYEAFIQIIQGMCRDADGLHRQSNMWRKELAPKAEGWLGGTYGVTDDNRFIGVVRFESKEAAARNSTRPEQGTWWARPEIIGGSIAIEPDGRFTETEAFRSKQG